MCKTVVNIGAEAEKLSKKEQEICVKSQWDIRNMQQ